MAKNLLIVESPAKAKTIEKILGSDFMVKSCFGHIRDLAKEDMGIDVENNFQPTYKISDDKVNVVKELKKLSKSSEEVWLATDEDREGEAISWHLCEVLGLSPENTKRIVFHEITKPAIQNAIKNPRTVNLDLVNAQQARRILDRLVGFEISPILWRKMSMKNNLSAGRVQSVAVKLIVTREREIQNFKVSSSFKIEAYFIAKDQNGKAVTFKAESPQTFKELNDAKQFLDSCVSAIYTVTKVEVKPGKRTPSAPFTTSTLQQEASRKLGYAVARTMQLAQRLYESGYITYMRTDSVNLSDVALRNIHDTIKNQYGANYLQPRKFANKVASSQEAHEAIRPTEMQVQRVSDPGLQSLYDLIWKRTMACQMADAQIEKTVAHIDISTNNEEFVATGEVLKFDGFLKAYTEGKDEDELQDDDQKMLPPLRPQQILQHSFTHATEKFTKHAPRFTEASLVKKLEELGIGRPSTYAPTISTIQNRGYVEKKDKEPNTRTVRRLRLDNNTIENTNFSENYGAEKSKLFPSDLGSVVTDFLSENFKQVMDYAFTAKIEQEFDEISKGQLEWSQMISTFYQPFHLQVIDTMENAARIKGERKLGLDPKTGKNVYARLARFGPVIQIGEVDDEEKPLFANLRNSQSIETISLEEALELFKLPMSLGDYKGKEMIVNLGRFGPYIKWDELYVNIQRGQEPLDISAEEATQMIEEKLKAEAPIATYQDKPVTKGKGRFGPYLKWNEMFINVPRRYDFDNLSTEDINELIAQKIEKEANRYIKQWEKEKISIENGRWGPLIKFDKKKLKLPLNSDNEKYTKEELAEMSLEEVKKIIETQIPNAFTKKKAAKKTATKKATAKKSIAPKKSSTVKAAASKAPNSKPSKK